MNLKSPRFWINTVVLGSLVAGFAFVGQSAQQARVTGIRPLGLTNGAGDDGELVTAIDTSVDPYAISGPIVDEPVQAVSFDVALDTLPQVGPSEKLMHGEPSSPVEILTDGGQPDGVDPVVQTGRVRSNMPATNITFAGLDLTNWGSGWPPDTHGAVGPTHYIQAVNSSVAIYTKTTGSRAAAFTLNNFFNVTGTPCDNGNRGDPVVLYDHVAGRFIVTNFAWASTSGPFYECIAMAKTSNPVTGGWWQYALQVSATQMGDYPKLGIWHDGIYMGANMFTNASSYAGVKVWVLNRSDMMSGAALRNIAFTLGTSYFSVFPSTAGIATAMPAAGTPNYFFSNYGVSTSLRMWKFTTNWTTPASSTFTGPTSITAASYTKPGATIVPQSGTTNKLDTLGDRVMAEPWFVNIGGVPAVWVNFTVSSGGVTGLRWMEIRNPSTATSVYQQGTYQPDTTYRWLSSLAVDKQGNMALGYSASSASMFPAIRYAGRLATDALGTLGQGEATMFAGTGSQTSYTRWGDYASMTVDPSNGCTFWYTTEYYATTGTNWQTRIGSFKYPGCN